MYVRESRRIMNTGTGDFFSLPFFKLRLSGKVRPRKSQSTASPSNVTNLRHACVSEEKKITPTVQINQPRRSLV